MAYLYFSGVCRVDDHDLCTNGDCACECHTAEPEDDDGDDG